MKAYVPNFDLLTPKNISEALKVLKSDHLRPLAGGTDLMVLFHAGKLKEGKYLSLHLLSELKKISIKQDLIELGALTTYRQIRDSLELYQEFPLLTLAAKKTGAIAIQNRGTIGGNIANASPAADSPPALLCYQAKLKIKNESSERIIPLENFFLDYKKTDLKSDELIYSIILPRIKIKGQEFSFYHKVGTREGQAISKVTFCLRLFIENKKITFIRLALGSVAPTTVRAYHLENLLLNQNLSVKIIKQAQFEVLKDINPIDDIRSTAQYRKKITQNLTKFYLDSILH